MSFQEIPVQVIVTLALYGPGRELKNFKRVRSTPTGKTAVSGEGRIAEVAGRVPNPDFSHTGLKAGVFRIVTLLIFCWGLNTL
jgi:hypothetical protein